MQAARERGYARKAKQDLVEQVCAAFWKGNAKQRGPSISRPGHRHESDTLY
jgi:hypothetical protein